MIISGTITDKTTGETLPNASVYFSNAGGNITNNQGTASNLDGEYSITGEGDYLTASYTGYAKQTIPATSGRHDFALSSGLNLPEVIIKGKILWPRILAGMILLGMVVYLYKKLK